MPHSFRIKSAWASYLSIQIFWVLCIVLTPVALTIYPAKLCALPFCAVTTAGGLHMVHFRYEYNALLRKMARLIPLSKTLIHYLTPKQREPRYFIPLGVVYALAGVVSAILVTIA